MSNAKRAYGREAHERAAPIAGSRTCDEGAVARPLVGRAISVGRRSAWSRSACVAETPPSYGSSTSFVPCARLAAAVLNTFVRLADAPAVFGTQK